MGFWTNVKELLDYNGMTRKELSAKSDVPKFTIDKGIERDSDVSAVVAIKISKALNVSLEYLLDLKEITLFDENENKIIQLSQKYKSVLIHLENMKESVRNNFINLIEEY